MPQQSLGGKKPTRKALKRRGEWILDLSDPAKKHPPGTIIQGVSGRRYLVIANGEHRRIPPGLTGVAYSDGSFEFRKIDAESVVADGRETAKP
jgi:hypothetical protein